MEDVPGRWHHARPLSNVEDLVRVVRTLQASDRSSFKHGVGVFFHPGDERLVRVVSVERGVRAENTLHACLADVSYRLLQQATYFRDVLAHVEGVAPRNSPAHATALLGWRSARAFREHALHYLSVASDAALFVGNKSAGSSAVRLYANTLTDTLCVHGTSRSAKNVISAARAPLAQRL